MVEYFLKEAHAVIEHQMKRSIACLEECNIAFVSSLVFRVQPAGVKLRVCTSKESTSLGNF